MPHSSYAIWIWPASGTSCTKDMELGLEDDEAMVKCLANEWAHEDESTILEKQKGMCSLTDLDSLPQGASKSYVSVPVSPDEGLKLFRHIFTKTHLCSKYGKNVSSPRGCISDNIETCYCMLLTQSLCNATGYFFCVNFATNICWTSHTLLVIVVTNIIITRTYYIVYRYKCSTT